MMKFLKNFVELGQLRVFSSFFGLRLFCVSAINGSLHTGRQGRHVHLNNTSKRPGTREWEVTVVEDNEKKVKAPVSGCHLQWPRSPAVGATLNHFGDKSTSVHEYSAGPPIEIHS